MKMLNNLAGSHDAYTNRFNDLKVFNFVFRKSENCRTLSSHVKWTFHF